MTDNLREMFILHCAPFQGPQLYCLKYNSCFKENFWGKMYFVGSEEYCQNGCLIIPLRQTDKVGGFIIIQADGLLDTGHQQFQQTQTRKLGFKAEISKLLQCRGTLYVIKQTHLTDTIRSTTSSVQQFNQVCLLYLPY